MLKRYQKVEWKVLIQKHNKNIGIYFLLKNNSVLLMGVWGKIEIEVFRLRKNKFKNVFVFQSSVELES